MRMITLSNGKTVDGSKYIANGIVPDDGQIGVEWLELSELLNYRLYLQTV